MAGAHLSTEYVKSRRNYLEVTHWLPEDTHVLSTRT